MGQLMNYAFNSLDMSSAANDVIVVRHRDGTLRSTPFNVRFGKMKVIRPGEKVVTMEVNQRKTTAFMKMGDDGVAYWLAPVNAGDDCGSGLTSPISSPLNSPLVAPSAATTAIPPMTLEAQPAQPANSPSPPTTSPSKQSPVGYGSHADPSTEGPEGAIREATPPPPEEPLSAEDRARFSQLMQSMEAAQRSPRTNNDPSELRLSKFVSCCDLPTEGTGAHTSSPSSAQPPSRALEEDEELEEYEECSESGDEVDEDAAPLRSATLFRKTFTPLSKDLEKLSLQPGANVVRFVTRTTLRGLVEVQARIFLWDCDSRIILSDVDGTVTKSDLLGHILPRIGKDWTHPGVCSLYTAIANNGYHFMYLTARSLSQIEQTRRFLFDLTQHGLRLPDGPVFTAPDRFFEAFKQEVIAKRAHEFKISCLDSVRAAFATTSKGALPKPFYAGFGNRVSDVVAYTTIGVPQHKIFIIDEHSVVHVCHVHRTYRDLAQLVDETFPPVRNDPSSNASRGVRDEPDFNSYNFWRIPPVDLVTDEKWRGGRGDLPQQSFAHRTGHRWRFWRWRRTGGHKPTAALPPAVPGAPSTNGEALKHI